jgi:hypothetical protein
MHGGDEPGDTNRNSRNGNPNVTRIQGGSGENPPHHSSADPGILCRAIRSHSGGHKVSAQRYIGGHIPVNIYDRIKIMAEKEQRPVVWVFKKLIEEGLDRAGL